MSFRPPFMRPQQQRGGYRFRGPRPPWGGRGRGNDWGGGPPFQGFGMPPLQVLDVCGWLDHQPPMFVKQVFSHAKYILETQGIPLDDDDGNENEVGHEDKGGMTPMAPPPPMGPQSVDDTSSWYDESVQQPPQQQQPPPNMLPPMSGPPPMKRPRMPMPGVPPPQVPPYGMPPRGPMQWTPGGWVVKDNSHKVTSTMKPLPDIEIIPPPTPDYPEAGADRDKLAILINNVNMMQFELNKICKRFKISSLSKDNDLSSYPEEQREKLKTARHCVSAAEKTLQEFKDYLKQDKYKVWHEEQEKARQDQIKAMIGETPSGVPYKRPEQSESENNEDVAKTS